ncbi:MAG: hypothetical protein JO105_20590 [Hyphomicrobiales bacterium]|nr:hypothetical protein [Hyphomicrobiales bacterium]
MTPLTQKPGYSGKSLATKLGVKPGQQLLAIDAPVNYAQMVAPLPEGATIRLGTWGETTGSAGLIHAFFFQSENAGGSPRRAHRITGAAGHFLDFMAEKIFPVVSRPHGPGSSRARPAGRLGRREGRGRGCRLVWT